MWRVFIAGLTAAGLVAVVLAAQVSYTASDAEKGGQLYRTSCANCHGPDGNFVPGIDLFHGKFHHAGSDADLVGIIMHGIAGTAMPPSSFTQQQAATIAAYLRSMAAGTGAGASSGDASRGRQVFERSGCMDCHRVNGQGSRVGPDLSNIGALRKPAQIEQSILDPDAEILSENHYVRAVTKDGETITGRILSEDTFTLQIIDSKERLISLDKSSLREYAFMKSSSMPSYRGKLSRTELADLISYLVSLKGVEAR